MRIIFFITLLVFLITYCAADDIHYCSRKERRRKFCPQIYKPVIGVFKNGHSKKFGNGCEACSAGVKYWKPLKEKKRFRGDRGRHDDNDRHDDKDKRDRDRRDDRGDDKDKNDRDRRGNDDDKKRGRD
jgi:hypothetical protein